MKKNYCYLIMMFLWFIPSLMNAQQMIQVFGKVTDVNGEAMSGVTIKGKGTAVAVSDINGKYSITCSSKDVLKFSFLGYKTQHVDVEGRKLINVTLEDVNIELNGVVVTGYGGVIKKKDLISSTYSISGDELKNIPVTDVTQALVGRIPGVQITQSSGALDAEMIVNFRGGTSITQNNSPLYIIDGVPSENGLNGLSTTDIERIDFFKDASATAIYGARGANGVIVVTTKGSRPSKTSVTYEPYFGMNRITSYVNVLDARDFVKLEFERNSLNAISRYGGSFAKIDSLYPVGSGVNWQKFFFGQAAPSINHRISLNGGDDKTNYTLSFSRNDAKGIMQNSGLSQTTARLNLNSQITRKIKVSGIIGYSNKSIQGTGELEAYKSRMISMLRYRPTAGYKTSDEALINSPVDSTMIAVLNDPYLYVNPLSNLESEDRTNNYTSLTGTGTVEMKLFKDVVYRGMFGYAYVNSSSSTFYSIKNPVSILEGGAKGIITHNFSNNYSINNTLNYSKSFNNQSNLLLLLGQEYRFGDSFYENMSSGLITDPNFGINALGMGQQFLISTSKTASPIIESFFGRVNYNLNGKYLFQGTLRADATSRFGENYRWGYFPSGGIGWRIGEENVIKKMNIFSNLKLRASYGVSGNSNISYGLAVPTLGSSAVAIGNQPVQTFGPTNIPNPDLRWEKNITANLGLDFGFFQNKLSGTIEIYDTKTKDLLLNSNVPLSSGFTTVMRNIGATQNRGLEFEVNSVNFNKKDFYWCTNFNISFNKNKVIALANADYFEQTTSTSSVTYLVKVGEPLGLMYGYVSDGAYQVKDFETQEDPVTHVLKFKDNKYILKTGVPKMNGRVAQPGFQKFKDLNGDSIITAADRTIIGHGQPKFFGGFGNNFRYKGFDLSVFVNFSVGNKILNASALSLSNLYTSAQNVTKKAYEQRYSYVDVTGKNIQYDPLALDSINVNSKGFCVTSPVVLSSQFVEDGSFIRINNITMGYTLPDKLMKKLKIQKLRIYGTIYNVYTITSYSGFDPEVSATRTSITPGIDYGSHPKTRSTVIGLSLTF